MKTKPTKADQILELKACNNLLTAIVKKKPTHRELRPNERVMKTDESMLHEPVAKGHVGRKYSSVKPYYTIYRRLP